MPPRRDAGRHARGVEGRRRRTSPPRCRRDDARTRTRRRPLRSLFLLLSAAATVDSLGYLKLPRSRNLVAYEDTVWWPRTETDPEPETTPQGADRGGTLAQCGIIETLRNYDLPKNIFGDLMPINVQAVYEQEQEITIEVSLISSNGGHFQFSMCPIEWGEIPTQECFDAHPLEFVKDNYYGAYEDPNYPDRIYIPDGKVTGRVEDLSGFPGNKQEFSYRMDLPCGLTGDLVLLQWYFVTAQDCYHEGYLDYKFPPEWGDTFEEKINECPSPLPPDGDGLPLQYWNCAEVQILRTGETERCAPTARPTGAPTRRVTRRPTNEPTRRPTPRPVEDTLAPATALPTASPVDTRPLADCDDLCLVPIGEDECELVPDGGRDLPPCLDPVQRAEGKTVNVGQYCEGSGECDTSNELNNCPGRQDVYKRTPSCARDDSGTTPEDTPLSLPVLENDVGEGLTIVDVGDPEHGTVEILDEEVVYTPDPGYNGPDAFEYTVIDINGFISEADVTVEVTPVNDAPIANNDIATTPANTNVFIPVLDNDVDPDPDDPVTITSVTQPENGIAGIRPDGTVVYKPDPDFVGTDEFTYEICDEQDQCDEATVTVEVEPPPNEPPVAEDDFVTISEGLDPGPVIPVLVNDEDPDGDPLEVTEVGVPENGVAEIADDGEGVIYTPNEDFTGVDTFEYKACDPGGLCDTATVTVTVDPSNNDPIVFDDRESTPEGEPVVVDVLDNDIPDIGLEVTEVSDPTNGTCVITSDGRVEYAPDEGFVGRDECTYTACVEGTDDCDEGTLIVDVVEKPEQPPLAVDDTVTTDEDVPVTLDPLENDKSPSGSPIEVVDVTSGSNGNCTVNENGTVTYTPNAGYSGIDLCLYTVCDEDDLCDEGAIVISVEEEPNLPPTAQDDYVDTPYETPIVVDVTANDSDPDGDALMVTEVTQGLFGECSITNTNEILYEPNAEYSGPDICPYVVCDPSGECATANVFVEVGPGPPDAEDDRAVTAPETPVVVDVLENDSHPTKPIEVTGITSQPQNGRCTIVDGKVQYTPLLGHLGSDSCTYEVCIEGSTEICSEADLIVDTVEPTDPPVAIDDETETTPETPVVIDVIENDSHPTEPIEVTDITSQPENGVCVVVDGKVEYTPNAGHVGTDSCTYEVCVEGTSDICSEADVVVETMDSPVAEDDEDETTPETPVVVDVLENDSHPDNLPLEVTDITSPPANGICEVVDGKVQYTPNAGHTGDDSCTYEVCVEGSSKICSEADVVVETIEPPVAEDDRDSTIPDTPVVVDVIENDSHPSSKPIEVTDITSQPENGECVVIDGKVQYTPNDGYIGTDSCTYEVCVEGSSVCSEADVVVDTIDPIGPPVTRDDEDETPPGTPVVVDVTENDSHPTEPIEVTVITRQPENGACVVIDGKVQYTPNAGHIGTDSCTYEACVQGSSEKCSEADVVVETIQRPSAEDDKDETPSETPVIVDVIVNDSHPNKPIEVTDITSQPENGVCVVIDGKVQYIPDAGHTGPDTCTYEVCVQGSSKICSEADVVVETIEPISPPAAVDDQAKTTPETPVVVDVTQNDSHPDNLPLEVTDITNQGTNGICLIIDGKVQYTPNPGFSGGDSCDYSVCVKETEECDDATVMIDVSIEPPVAKDDKERTPVDTPVVSNVMENDFNPSLDAPLEITAVTQPDHGSCEFTSDGFVRYSPDTGFQGTDSCDYTVCIEGTTACDTGTLVVDVVEVKIADDDTAETPQDTPVTVDVLDNDSYSEDPERPLTVTDVTDAENGVCRVIDNQVQFVPQAGFSGSTSCKYTVCVEEIEVCDTGTLTVDVIPKPVANDDKAETAPNTPVLVDVKSNDEPQDPERPLEVTDISTQAQNGICEVVGGQVQYTPDEDFSGGADSCEYTVCIEGTALCDDGTLTVEVAPDATPPPTRRPSPPPILSRSPTARPSRRPSSKPTMGNTRPFAMDDIASTPANTPVTIDVLVNDFDFDGDVLTVIETTEPSNGRVQINPDSTVTYTPNNGFSGNDEFKYTITDGNGGTAEAKVIVSVVEPSQPKPDTDEPTPRPTPRPTMKPVQDVATCDDLCYEPLNPLECPSCDPSILPCCSDTSIEIGSLCESDGECGLDDQLNNCDGTFDVYRRVPCEACDDMCFEPLHPDECPSCDPSILPSCSDASMEFGALCESDGECGLDDQLNNCEGTFDVYRRVPCYDDICKPREGESTTISSSGDAYIAADDPDRGFNSEGIMVSEFPKVDGLIQWELGEEICECVTIDKVTLRLYVIDPSRGGGFVHIMNPTWDEDEVTWRNAPESSGPPLVKIGQAFNETWISADVTGLVTQSDEKVAVRIESCLRNQVQYASKEYKQGQFAPQLVIEFGPPPVGMHLIAPQLEGRSHYGRKLGRSSSSKDSSSKSESRKTSRSTTKKSSKSSKSSTKLSKDSSSNDGSREDSDTSNDSQDDGDGTDDMPGGGGGETDGPPGNGSGADGPPGNGTDSTPENGGGTGETPDNGGATDDTLENGDGTDGAPDNEGENNVMPDIQLCPDPSVSNILPTAVRAYATDDATIVYQNQDESFGSDVLLELSPPQCGDIHAVINFDVSSLVAGRMVDYASILIHAIEGSELSGATFVHAPSPDWSEDSVTWRNAPEYDMVIGSLSTIKNGMWYELDVTRIVQELSSDNLSIRVIPSAVTDASCERLQTAFASKELNDFGPQIVVVPKAERTPLEHHEQARAPASIASIDGIFSRAEPNSEPDYDDCSVGNTPSTGTIILKPTDDSYISPRKRRFNHGKEPVLFVDGRPGNAALLKFDLSCLKSQLITSAVLKIYSIDGSPNGGIFHVLTHDGDSAWDENGVTWNTSPSSNIKFTELKRVKTATWNEVDITNALDDNIESFVTIMIDSDSMNRVAYSSKEGGYVPHLIVAHEEYIIQPHLQLITCLRPAAKSLTFSPVEDALIKEEKSDSNFAHSSSLIAKYVPGSKVDSLLKFAFYCIYTDSLISKAVLKLYCKNGSTRGGKITTVFGAWTEDSVTWDKAPRHPSLFQGDIGRVREGKWVEIDVTSAIISMEDYELTFRIEGVQKNGAVYGSKEDDMHAPVLEIFF